MIGTGFLSEDAPKVLANLLAANFAVACKDWNQFRLVHVMYGSLLPGVP